MPSLTIIVFGVLIIMLILGVPIAFSLGIATLCGLLATGMPLIYLAETAFSGPDIFPLMAIPGFILAGKLMEKSGITRDIIEVMRELVGNFPGGLAIVTIFSCMFFSAITGSGPATVAAIGSIMIPAMRELGYPEDFAAAVSSTGGTLGILIPPSNPMIMYGVSANVSIAALFISGFLPGVILSIVLSITCYLIGLKKGYRATGERFSFYRIIKRVYDGKWALFTPVIVLGGIYAGYVTPTEGSMVAVLYALFIGVIIYRSLSFGDIYESLISTALMTGAILIIMGPACAFGKILTIYEIPSKIAEFILSISKNWIIIFLLINLFLIFVGTFMETLATIVLLTPILLPALESVGVDPIHFGILFVVCSEVGFLTPPLGVNLYVASALTGLTIEKIARSVLVFIAVMGLVIIFYTLVPKISLFGAELFIRISH